MPTQFTIDTNLKSKMILKDTLQNSIQLKQALLNDAHVLENMERLVAHTADCFKAGKRVYFCGNGGSAADAQHLSAELSGRYYFDRPPLPSEALHVNGSYVTAVANDYGYDEVFARAIKAFGQKGDILVGLSTSGNSKNVVKAFEVARELGMYVVAFTGEGGGAMAPLANMLFAVPSKDTPRIQEAHMLLGHTLCQGVEETLFS